MSASAGLFGPPFEEFDVVVDSVRIHGVRGGDGPPVLLLHGYPQSHVMWHRVATDLARDFTVVAPDLRGYGDSARPESGPGHEGYSFRAMAADQVGVMSALGYGRFAVVSHDRGARVAHRMTLDHPASVERLALMDILPTAYVYATIDQRVATAYYHWFFYLQPADLPERLIGADPEYYLDSILHGWATGAGVHHPDAVAAYRRAYADPAARHAMLEDYRAGATIDLTHDAASESAGERIGVPTLILYGERGVVGRNAESPVDVWRTRAGDPSLVTGQSIAGAGHWLVEENFDDTLAALRPFLLASGSTDQ